MKNNEIKYFRINHNNNTAFIDEESETNLTLSLFYTIASANDETIGKEFNLFFERFLSTKEKDQHKINLEILKNFSSKKSAITNVKITEVFNYILNKDFKTHFEFNKKNVSSLGLALFFCFSLFSDKSKKFSINNYSEFLDKISKFRCKKVDILQNYFDKESSSSNTLAPLHSSFRDSPNIARVDTRQDSFLLTLKKFSLGAPNEFAFSGSKDCVIQSLVKVYSYKFINNNQYMIPIEFLILVSKLQNVKKIIFTIEEAENVKEDYLKYLIILFNIEWLFPNLLEIDLVFKNKKLEEELNQYFQRKTEEIFKKAKLIDKRTNYNTDHSENLRWKEEEINSDDFDMYDIRSSSISTENKPSISSISGGSLEDDKNKKKNIKKILRSQCEKLDLIILYSYFASKWAEKIKILNLEFSESFSREIESYLQILNIKIFSFHFLSFVRKATSLVRFEASFNSLNMTTFDRIIGLIYNNSELKGLKLNLFPPEESFTPSNLYRLCNTLKMNMKTLLQKNNKIIISETLEDIDKTLLKRLLPHFEDNIEKLFFVIKSKTELNEIMFYLDLPSLITNSGDFTILLIKFLSNLLFLLNFSQIKISVFKFYARYLRFDGRVNYIIDEVLGNLSMETNKSLKIFAFQVQILHITNLRNLISYSLKSLFIGDFDLESLKDFVTIFEDEEFRANSSLVDVTIVLSAIVSNYAQARECLKKFFNVRIKSLKEQGVFSYIMLDQFELDEIINEIHFNPINKYVFEFEEKRKNSVSVILRIDDRVGTFPLNKQEMISATKKIIFSTLKKKNVKEELRFRTCTKIMNFLFEGRTKEVSLK